CRLSMALARTAMFWPFLTNELVDMYPNAVDVPPPGAGLGSEFGARPRVPNDDARSPALQRPYSEQFATPLVANSPNASRKRRPVGGHCVPGMSPTFPASSNPPPTPITMGTTLTRLTSLAPDGCTGSAHDANIATAAIASAAEKRPASGVANEASQHVW